MHTFLDIVMGVCLFGEAYFIYHQAKQIESYAETVATLTAALDVANAKPGDVIVAPKPKRVRKPKTVA